jgi:hypothetical protein
MLVQVYVHAKSKADINRRLKAGYVVVGIEHKMLEETKWPLTSLPDGALIKVWSKEDPDGVPIAKAYGRWDAKKEEVV